MTQFLLVLVNATHEQLGVLSKKEVGNFLLQLQSPLMGQDLFRRGHSFCMVGLVNTSYGTTATNRPETERNLPTPQYY